MNAIRIMATIACIFMVFPVAGGQDGVSERGQDPVSDGGQDPGSNGSQDGASYSGQGSALDAGQDLVSDGGQEGAVDSGQDPAVATSESGASESVPEEDIDPGRVKRAALGLPECGSTRIQYGLSVGFVPDGILFPSLWPVAFPGGLELEVMRGLRSNMAFVGKLEAFHPVNLTIHSTAVMAGVRFGQVDTTRWSGRSPTLTLMAGFSLWSQLSELFPESDLDPTEQIDRTFAPGLFLGRLVVPLQQTGLRQGYGLGGVRLSSDFPVRRVHHPDGSVETSTEWDYASTVMGPYVGWGMSKRRKGTPWIYFLEVYAEFDAGLFDLEGLRFTSFNFRFGAGSW